MSVKATTKTKREKTARILTPVIGVGVGVGAGFGLSYIVPKETMENLHLVSWLPILLGIAIGFIAYVIYHLIAKFVDGKRETKNVIAQAKVDQGKAEILSKDEAKQAKIEIKKAQANINKMAYKVRKSEEVSKTLKKTQAYE
jgi:hypothetical protein